MDPRKGTYAMHHDDIDTTDFHAVTDAFFVREMTSFGIGDGMARRAMDPDYAGHAEYREGYAIGLTLPAAAPQGGN